MKVRKVSLVSRTLLVTTLTLLSACFLSTQGAQDYQRCRSGVDCVIGEFLSTKKQKQNEQNYNNFSCSDISKQSVHLLVFLRQKIVISNKSTNGTTIATIDNTSVGGSNATKIIAQAKI